MGKPQRTILRAPKSPQIRQSLPEETAAAFERYDALSSVLAATDASLEAAFREIITLQHDALACWWKYEQLRKKRGFLFEDERQAFLAEIDGISGQRRQILADLNGDTGIKAADRRFRRLAAKAAA